MYLLLSLRKLCLEVWRDRNAQEGVLIFASSRALAPLGLLMPRELGARFVYRLLQYLAQCLLAVLQTLGRRERHFVICCSCHLPLRWRSSHLERSPLWRSKFLLQLCHLGAVGLWSSSTTSLNLSPFITRYVRKRSRSSTVLHVLLTPAITCEWIRRAGIHIGWLPQSPHPRLSLSSFWHKVSHCIPESLVGRHAQWVLEISLSLPPKCHQAHLLHRSWGSKLRSSGTKSSPRLCFIVELFFVCLLRKDG